MKKYLKYILPMVVAGMVIYTVCAYVGFSRKGLDAWLAGQTDGDHYPDWEKDTEVLEVERDILKKAHLFFSKVYFIQSSGSCQLRFRIAYSVPFLHGDLLGDTRWVKLADSDGKDYSGCLTVYPSKIAGLNCLNVALVMDADTASALSGGKLNVSLVCTEGGLEDEKSYASCEAEIQLPEIAPGMEGEHNQENIASQPNLIQTYIGLDLACKSAILEIKNLLRRYAMEDKENSTPGFRKNPIITSIYTADPAPMVYGDTLYLYTSHDEDTLVNNFYTMVNWHCFSTKDMVNWTDHGEVFSLDDISWADDRAWAPQAVARNGKFYLYCPVHKKNGGMAIAVGISDSPTGPFKDLKDHPIVDEGDWNDIDPTVFIDDDGQAYLYFGNPELRYVLLNKDMITYDKTVGVVKVPMTEESFAKGSHATGTTYGEGPWFYKRNGIYYMVYAAFGEGKQNEHLAYSTSTGPTGPWVYGGVLMTEEGGVFTNHPGIVDFKGHSYLFYHTGDLPGGNLFQRSVCVAEFHYNEDGSIDTIEKCDGVEEIR